MKHKTAEDIITKHWLFVDTNQYAGNFEREMGAHMTGVVGNEYFPDEATTLANKLLNEHPELMEPRLEDSIFADMLGRHDWDGEHDPSYVATWDNGKTGVQNSVALIFTTLPTSEQLKLLKHQAETFPKAQARYNKGLKILGIRMIEVTTTSREIPI